MAKIHEAICSIMNELGAIGKNQKNQKQGFLYRGVDDVMNALQPLLAKHKIFIVPEVLEQTREARRSSTGSELLYSILKMQYSFIADDGSSLSAVVIGEGMDSGDKASNKAMSIAFKYACFQVFCIPTEEMPDPDADTPPPTYAVKSPAEAEKEARRTGIIEEILANTNTMNWNMVEKWVRTKFGASKTVFTIKEEQFKELVTAMKGAM